MYFIDFHTHVYPDPIAPKAAESIRAFYELNSETDFVAKNPLFTALCEKVGKAILASKATNDEETNSYPIPFNKFKGIRFESLINGNSIFIPACGYCDGSLLYDISYYGRLWSSSLHEFNSSLGRILYFDHNGYLFADSYWYRYFGLCVLGVKNLYLNNQ